MGIVLAAVCKFLFLQISLAFVLKSILASNLTSAAATMVSWPQLVTALVGGFVAYTFLKAIKKI
jgi:hypothetical protein